MRNFIKYRAVAVAQWLNPGPGEPAMPGSAPTGGNRIRKINNQKIQDTLGIEKPNVRDNTDIRLKEITLLCLEVTSV